MTQRSEPNRLLAVFLVAIAQVGCALAWTPGDTFRKKMADIKAYCHGRQLSPGETTCNILALKPEDPLATAEGRLAHSIKLPPTVPATTYRLGMGADAYFNELCREAGEFIFTTVKDVEGVMQMRPRKIGTHDMNEHLYAQEDPYGYRDWEARNPQSFYVGPKSYRFLEAPGENGKVLRYHGYDGRDRKTMKSEIATAAKSRYGFTWRGISRPNDRELGIAGGELIVVDLSTFQVLGVKRGFARTGDKPFPPPIWWRMATVCPGDSNAIYALGDFVTQVLIPAQR
jgi:hypothetical protein